MDHAQTSWDAETLNRVYGTRSQNALVTSWSVAKSITSIIFGIALEQGYFSGSLDTTAATYLDRAGEWAGNSKSTITIKNLLDMRSGLVPKCYSDVGGWTECDGAGIAGGGGFVNSNDQLTECIQNRSMAATEARHSWYQSGGYDFNKEIGCIKTAIRKFLEKFFQGRRTRYQIFCRYLSFLENWNNFRFCSMVAR